MVSGSQDFRCVEFGAYGLMRDIVEQEELLAGRGELIACGLVVYERPLCQLLTLDPHKGDSRQRTGRTLSVGDFLRIPEGGEQ